MKKLCLALGALLLAVLVWWVFQGETIKPTAENDHSPSPSSPVAHQEHAPQPRPPAAEPQAENVSPPDRRVAELKKKYPQFTEEEITSALRQGIRLERLEQAPRGMLSLKAVTTAFEMFKKEFGAYPKGNNIEIATALLGGNPTHTVFLDNYKERFTDSSGALVDAWKTPLLIEVKADNLLSIRSAGPDRVFWSADDVLLH